MFTDYATPTRLDLLSRSTGIGLNLAGHDDLAAEVWHGGGVEEMIVLARDSLLGADVQVLVGTRHRIYWMDGHATS